MLVNTLPLVAMMTLAAAPAHAHPPTSATAPAHGHGHARAEAAAGALSPRLARISADEFAQRTTLAIDRESGEATLSTQSASKHEGPSRWLFVEEAHARVVADPATGRSRWEIWHEVSHDGVLDGIAAIRYEVNGAHHVARPHAVEHWQGYCPPADWGGGCLQFARFKFEIPADHVRAIAGRHVANSRQPWSLRFEDRTGKTVAAGFAPAELAGLVKAHDAWRQAAR